MKITNAILAHAARTYRIQASPAFHEAAQDPGKARESYRIEGLKIDLSPDARSYLARSANMASAPAHPPERQSRVNTIQPNGAGRREAPMRTANPVWQPPGNQVDLSV
jgi:hypothetical protein